MTPDYDADHALSLFGRQAYEELVVYCRSYVDHQVPEAACMLGTLHQLGLGVRRNPQQAERLLLRAANGGFPLAWCNLGTLYASGELGAVDEGKARECYQRAYDLGAPTNLDFVNHQEPSGDGQ